MSYDENVQLSNDELQKLVAKERLASEDIRIAYGTIAFWALIAAIGIFFCLYKSGLWLFAIPAAVALAMFFMIAQRLNIKWEKHARQLIRHYIANQIPYSKKEVKAERKEWDHSSIAQNTHYALRMIVALVAAYAACCAFVIVALAFANATNYVAAYFDDTTAIVAVVVLFAGLVFMELAVLRYFASSLAMFAKDGLDWARKKPFDNSRHIGM